MSVLGRAAQLGVGNQIAFDDFSESDNTNIISKPLDIGGTWSSVRVISGGVSKVLSGVAAETIAGGASYHACSATGASDVNIKADFFIGTGVGSSCVLIGRWNGSVYAAGSAGTFIQAVLEANYGMIIYKCVNGTYTALATNTTNIPSPGTLYPNVSLLLSGTSALLTVPGLGNLSATIPASTNTRHGFGVNKVTIASTCDNFMVAPS